MARLPRRIDHEGAVHHVWGRGNGKRPIFHDAEDYRCFLRRLTRLKEELGFAAYAYCLMTNHYHLVIKTGGVALSRIMHRLLTSYTRIFNDRWNQVGHLFQGRFGNRLLNNDVDLMVAIKYVHANPQEARMVDSLEDWSWSGHHALSGRPDEILDVAFVLDLFGGAVGYADFMKRTVAVPDRPALEAIADSLGGAASLRLKSQHRVDVARRREFVEQAVQLGYKQRAIARFLGRTEAAVSYLLRDP